MVKGGQEKKVKEGVGSEGGGGGGGGGAGEVKVIQRTNSLLGLGEYGSDSEEESD